MILALTTVVLASAQSRSEKVEYQESSARNLEPQQTVIITPLIADMKIISGKIEYTEKEAFKNYMVTTSIVSAMPSMKSIALSNAAKKYGADVIVAATIDIITNTEGCIEITVTGYPAKYVNFRNATIADVQLVKLAGEADKASNTAIFANPDNVLTVTNKNK